MVVSRPRAESVSRAVVNRGVPPPAVRNEKQALGIAKAIAAAGGEFRVAAADSVIGIEALARRGNVPGVLPPGEPLGLPARFGGLGAVREPTWTATAMSCFLTRRHMMVEIFNHAPSADPDLAQAAFLVLLATPAGAGAVPSNLRHSLIWVTAAGSISIHADSTRIHIGIANPRKLKLNTKFR
jgi:hypothetical protein